MKNPNDTSAKRSRIPPGNFNLIEHPYRPGFVFPSDLTWRIEALQKQGRLQTALNEIFKVLDTHPDDREALMLAMIIMGTSRTEQLQAQEPISQASLLNRHLDPIYTVCSQCRVSSWVSGNSLFGEWLNEATVLNPAGLQCYNCGYVVCRNCLERFGKSHSMLNTGCPNCGGELRFPVFPTGRLSATAPQLAAPLARIILFREGPIPPDSEHIQKVLKHFCPDAPPGLRITTFPIFPWRDDMTSLVMMILLRMEGDGELPPGSTSSAIYMPFQFRDEPGIREYIVKTPQLSPIKPE